MKSAWSRPNFDGAHTPVEMRFIDMFMTALGALIFIALLLIILLPQAARTTQQSARSQTSKPGGKDLTNKVLRRWLGVTLLTKGCNDNDPALYVRWDADLYDVETGTPSGRMPQFSAASPPAQILFGNRLFGLYPESIEAHPIATGVFSPVSTELLKDTGLQVRTFQGVAAAAGGGSIYVVLRDPRSYSNKTCTLEPVYLSVARANAWKAPVVDLKQATPFAWLATFFIGDDGELTVNAPDAVAHEVFSDEQSHKLCLESQLCDTRDAQLKPTKPQDATTPGGAIEWHTGKVFDGYGYAVDMSSTKQVCEEACLADDQCAAIEFREAPRYCARHRQVSKTRASPDMQVGTKAATRTAPPVNWTRDSFVDSVKPSRTTKVADRDECGRLCAEDAKCLTVEYIKPDASCQVFHTKPKITASALSNSTRDVGTKGEPTEPEKTAERPAAKDNASFVQHDNYDIVGGDMREIKNTSHDACAAACDSDTACKAYSFDKWNHWCFLKRGADRFRLEPNTVSGLRAGTPTPQALSKPPRMVRFRNKAFPYDGQGSSTAASIDECEARCNAAPSCVALTFFKKRKLCRLMETTLEYMPDPDADSSVKRQEEDDAKAGEAH